MAESTKPGRRARRSTSVSRRLEEARRRNAEQLAKQREQERRVDDALAAFFDAGEQLGTAEKECQRRIEPHERAIEQLRDQFESVVTEQETAQARAALSIHEADRTVEQVGELLGLGEKAARRLIAQGREAAAKDSAAEQTEVDTPPPNPGSDVRQEEAGGDGPEAARLATPNGTAAGASSTEDRPLWSAGGRSVPEADEVGA